jgi:flagellin
MQADFLDNLMDSIDRGVSRLIDADMEEVSARLAAEQTRTQLALSSLNIANSAPTALLQLFN